MKIARLTLCVGALAIVSATSAMAAPAYVMTNVNMRSGPATTNEVVTRIPGGSLIEANNCKDGWCEVSWQGKNGYAIQTSLDLSGRVPSRPRTSYQTVPGPGYVESGPPVYYGPGPYYYGPRYYYGGPYWRRRHWW
jgi:uncharacterized protein YraI